MFQWQFDAGQGHGRHGAYGGSGYGGSGYGGSGVGGSGGLGGSGGTGGSQPSIDWGKVIASPTAPGCKSLFDYAVLDSQYAYHTCEGDPATYSSTPQYTFFRAAIPNGKPEGLLTTDGKLEIMTKDDAAYYLWKWSKYNSSTGWDYPAVERLPMGSQTLQELEAPQVNQPGFITQDQTALFMGDGGAYKLGKLDGAFSGVASTMRSPVEDVWLATDQLEWVSGSYTGAAPAAYQVPQAGGPGGGATPQKLFDFPDLCIEVVHDPSTGGFWAFCLKTAQDQVVDVIHYTALGPQSTQKQVTSGVGLAGIGHGPMVVGSTCTGSTRDMDWAARCHSAPSTPAAPRPRCSCRRTATSTPCSTVTCTSKRQAATSSAAPRCRTRRHPEAGPRELESGLHGGRLAWDERQRDSVSSSSQTWRRRQACSRSSATPVECRPWQHEWPRFSNPEGTSFSVATHQGRPVGLASVHLIPMVHRDGSVARLTAFVVTENMRGQRLGSSSSRCV